MARDIAVKYTYSDLQSAPDDGKRYEIFEGELIVTPAPSSLHQIVSDNILYVIKQYEKRTQTGKAISAPIDVYFDDETVIQPDVLFILSNRLDIIEEKRIRGAPDLIVEVLSKSTAERDRGYKLRRYFAEGVQEYWIVDPDERTIELYTGSPKGFSLWKKFNERENFSSVLIPELSFALKEIWE